MKKVIIPLVLGFITVSFPGQLSSAPSEGKAMRKAPKPPVTITQVPSKLTLSWFVPSNRTCSKTPNDQSNPALNPGASSLASPITYYCKVTVEPNAPTNMYAASTYKFTWLKAGSYLDIKVPKEVGGKITVDFYENCNNCIDGKMNRPIWHGTDMIQKGQPNVNVNLNFTGVLGGC
ncbi:hypothetical protein [Longitalea luteola]|uniref:hypothetical protein n=1 Tax=Longitalea luteola TaxID=2812563 RepID=UPI001A96E53C|nr:hypothetical protein [Longitalea luteola]